MKIPVLSLLLCALLSGCIHQIAKNEEITFSGVAVDGLSNLPVAGATVTLYEKKIKFPRLLPGDPAGFAASTMTDKDGKFTFTKAVDFPVGITVHKDKTFGAINIEDKEEDISSITVKMNPLPKEWTE